MRFIYITTVLAFFILAGCRGPGPVQGTVVQTYCGYRSTVMLEEKDGWARSYVVDYAECESMSVGAEVLLGEPVLAQDWDKSPFSPNESKNVSIRYKEGK